LAAIALLRLFISMIRVSTSGDELTTASGDVVQ
jgi:hypothetical protein